MKVLLYAIRKSSSPVVRDTVVGFPAVGFDGTN